MDRDVGADPCVCPADHRANTSVRPCLLACAEWTPLVAQIERARELFPWPKTGSVASAAVLLVLLILLLAVFAFALAKRLRRKKGSGPLMERLLTSFFFAGPAWALFTELVSAHALSGEEEKLLERLARREKLSNPAILFVEKRHLQRARESDPQGGWWELHEKLFGG